MNARSTRTAGLPGYRLLHWIGASASAAVYAAVAADRTRVEAVKIFHCTDVLGLTRLERRLQANARLAHPNIVGVHAIGRTADGRLFHGMPLLRGFEQVRPELTGRPSRIAAVLRDLLAALAHAHQCGRIHGNIAPANVLFDASGHARLGDFGIAMCLAEMGWSRSGPRDGDGIAQPRCVASDPHSDLGAVALLAGTLLAGTPRMPASAAQSGAWQEWLDRALAAAPGQRFQTAEEMVAALPSVPIPPRRGAGQRHGGGSTRRGRARRWLLPAIAYVVAIVAIVVWFTWPGSRTPQRARLSAAVTAAPTNVPVAATAMTPAVPAAAPPAPAGSSLLAQRVAGLVATADSLRARGDLFTPPFHNAASHYLAALAFDPGNADATAGIDALLATLRARLDRAWRTHPGNPDLGRMLRQGDELSAHAGPSSRRTWQHYRAKLAQQVGAAIANAARTQDTAGIKALARFAKKLPATFPPGFDPAAAKSLAMDSSQKVRRRAHDPEEPELVSVPAAAGAPAFAIARVEVTRSDYAAFVRATHRPASSCRAAHNPFSRFRHLTWRAPGFAQGGNHPVVCVSWDDAVAYVAWLSKTTGEAWRLPSNRQWLRAARGLPVHDTPCQLGNVDDASRRNRLDNDRWHCDDGAAQTAPVGHYAASGVGAYDMYGNVSEWLDGGTPGSRQFRGLSWRDGSHETPLGSRGTADSKVGYTSVGFRVVRVFHRARPAAALISAH